MTRRVAAATKGYFGIASGDAMFRTSVAARPPKDEDLVIPTAFFPGTIVCVEVGLTPDADFSAILALAREAFGSRMQAKQARLSQRVRFT